MSPEFTSGETYEATVESVDDGDTLNVTFADGSTKELRVIGFDTPETAAGRVARDLSGTDQGSTVTDTHPMAPRG